MLGVLNMVDQLLNLDDQMEPEEIKLVKLALHLVAVDQIVQSWELSALIGVDIADVVEAHSAICISSEVSFKTLSIAYHCLNNICLGPAYLAEKSIELYKVDIDALLHLSSKVRRILGNNLLFGWGPPTGRKQ